jgi:hypothetical protein
MEKIAAMGRGKGGCQQRQPPKGAAADTKRIQNEKKEKRSRMEVTRKTAL